MKHLPFVFATVAAMSLAGCGGGASTGSGSLSMGITDAPVDDPTAVVTLTISGLEIQGPAGRVNVDFNPAKQITISQLVNGASAELLSNYSLPAGHYDWIRLKVDTAGLNDSYLTLGGTNYELTIPSAAQTGLKLVRGFDVPVNGSADFTIDFNLRKSIVEDANGYLLKPVLRIVDNVQIGKVAGSVDLNTMCSAGSNLPAVYVYQGSGVTPTDINTVAGTGPITSARIDATGDYQAAFLSPGDYTLAVACNAGADQPETSESIGFATPTHDVTVVAGETVQQNFP